MIVFLKQIWPYSEVGTLPASWPRYIPGNAKVAFHERTGTDCQNVWSLQTGSSHRVGKPQAAAAVVCPATWQEFLSKFLKNKNRI